MRAQKRLIEVIEKAPEQTHIETKRPQLPTSDEIISSQGTDVYFEKIRRSEERPGLSFNFDRNRLLVRHSTIVGSVQKVLLQSVGPDTVHSCSPFNL